MAAAAVSQPLLRGREALDFLAADGRPRSPLSWAAPPRMELATEGHAAWIVRTPSHGGQGGSAGGKGSCRLMREFDLRPNPVGAPKTPSQSGQTVERQHIKLRVMERDLKRCSGDLELLKRCDLDCKRPDLSVTSSRCSTPSGESAFVRRVGSMPRLVRRSTVGLGYMTGVDSDVGSAMTPGGTRSTPSSRHASLPTTPVDGGATPVGGAGGPVVRRVRSEAMLRVKTV